MPGLKAIETVYKGYRFRSRLEARWAVYFDTLGCDWLYEPEGFDLGDAGKYLPDFWLSTVNMWAEVKAKPLSDDELRKANALALASKHHVVHLVGTPDMKAYDTSYYCAGCVNYGPNGMEIPLGEHIEYVEALLTAEYLHSEHRWFWAPGGGEVPCDVAQRAVIAARSARFEHGESGAPKRSRGDISPPWTPIFSPPSEPPRRHDVPKEKWTGWTDLPAKPVRAWWEESRDDE